MARQLLGCRSPCPSDALDAGFSPSCTTNSPSASEMVESFDVQEEQRCMELARTVGDLYAVNASMVRTLPLFDCLLVCCQINSHSTKFFASFG